MSLTDTASRVTPESPGSATRPLPWTLDRIDKALAYGNPKYCRSILGEIHRFNLDSRIVAAVYIKPRPVRLDSRLYVLASAFSIAERAALNGALERLAGLGVIQLVRIKSDLAIARPDSRTFRLVRSCFGSFIRYGLYRRGVPEPLYEVEDDRNHMRAAVKLSLLEAIAEAGPLAIGRRSAAFNFIRYWLRHSLCVYETLLAELAAEGYVQIDARGNDLIAVVPPEVRRLVRDATTLTYAAHGSPMRLHTDPHGVVVATMGCEGRDTLEVAA
jgi:hypothetical protein